MDFGTSIGDCQRPSRRGISNEAEDIIVTPDSEQATFEALQLLVDFGDEVILDALGWVSYETIVSLASSPVTRVDTRRYDLQLDPAIDHLSEIVDNSIQLITIKSISNPTDAFYSKAALQAVRDLAVEVDLAVISGEIYVELTHDGDCAMTGLRLSYMTAPSDFIKQAGQIHTHTITCASNFAQHAAVEAFKNGHDAVDDMVDTFYRRRDFLVEKFEGKTSVIARPRVAST